MNTEISGGEHGAAFGASRHYYLQLMLIYLGGGHCRCCRSQSRECHIKSRDSFVGVSKAPCWFRRQETAGCQLSRRFVCRVVLAVWRGCANIFWGVEDSSAWWVTNRSRIGKKCRGRRRGCGAGNFCFWRSLFFPCLVGAASERVAWYKKCPGDKNTVPPRKGYLLVRRACFSPKPGSGNKGEGGIRCPGTWEETDRGGVGSRISATARLSDTQLRRNRRHQKRSRILMGEGERVTRVR